MLFSYPYLLLWLMVLEEYEDELLLNDWSSDSDIFSSDESSYVSEESGLNSCKLRQLQEDLETPSPRHGSKDANGRQIQAGTAKSKAPRVDAWVNDQRKRMAKQPHDKQPEKNQPVGSLPQPGGSQAAKPKPSDVQVPNVPTSSTPIAKQPLASPSAVRGPRRAPSSKRKTREVPADWQPRRSKRTRIAPEPGRVGGADLRSQRGASASNL